MKTKYKVLAGLMAMMAYGCEDIIEEDISDDEINITYPRNQQIESNVVTFQWSALDGADDYRVQVYAENQNMVLDSLVETNSFTYELDPGTYQWRVRGENFAYETPYTFPVSFTMIATEDLTDQQVQLSSPAAGLHTQNTTQTFSWNGLAAAQQYAFQLVNITNGNAVVYQQDAITGTTLTLPSGTIAQDGQYQWKVKGISLNNGTETQYSTRTLYVDTTAPNPPQNAQPADESFEDAGIEVTLEWNTPPDVGVVTSAMTYIIQIATNESFGNVVLTDESPVETYDYTFTSEGDYYWRVKSVDAAGNESSYSTPFLITIE